MERNLPETGGVLTTKSNGRKNNTQPLGSRHLSRKSWRNPESKENSIVSDTDGGAPAIPRPTRSNSSIPRHHHSESLIENRLASASPSPSLRVDRSTAIFGTPSHSRSTRIPRPATAGPITNNHNRDIPKNHLDRSPNQSPDPSSPMRQPINLLGAYERAKQQLTEEERTSAEKNTNSDNTTDFRRAFYMAHAEFDAVRGIDGSPSPAPRSFRREFKSTMPLKYGAGVKKNDLSMHLERFDRNHQLNGRNAPLTGLFTKPTAPGTGQVLAEKTSADSLDDKSIRHRPDARATSLKSHEKTDENGALVGKLPTPGAILGTIGADIPVPSIENEHGNDDEPSLNFEPTDISPEKSNWHLDADFTAGDLQFSASPRIMIRKPSSDMSHEMGTPVSRRSNHRLDRIQQREIEAARMTFPEDTPVVKQMSHKLDEIRVREMEALSRRAVASSRLDEIRIKNSEPRTGSPEMHEDLYKKPLEEEFVHPDNGGQNTLKPSSNIESRGEPICDTPVVVFKDSTVRNFGVGDRDRTHENNSKRGALSRSDSHDLLRRLARATSLSPRENPKETEQGKGDHPIDKTDTKQFSQTRILNRSSLPQEEGRARNLEVKNSKDRLTVGFADLIGIPSGDSTEEKRTSMPTSEVDPTDRITAELNLFAPLDNYSEKGSIRAPSPVPSEPIDEETPRPPKIDPLTQPTPRVIGAYVDTPATVRVKGEGGHAKTSGKPSIPSELAATTQRPTSNLSPMKRITNTSSTGRARSLNRSGPRSSSVPTASHRARSSSRRRRPLINSARPPTVREDIIAILRANNIDDSTLENLDSILADQQVDDQELKQMVNDTVIKVEDDLEVKFSEMSDRERELEAYDRMSKSLQTGLLGIRSAKKGIERLEDKVTHTGGKDSQIHLKAMSSAQPLARPSISPDGATSVFITIPRLYRRNPKFKLTTLGIITICTMIWYAIECTFCYLYAGPEYICTPTIPCDWSPNEPYFPYTTPFMLDEWVTGGKGRAVALKVGEEVGDILAEISDWATNTDFTQYDERYMDVWQRKRHKRRLRKHALIPRWTEPFGYKIHFSEWQAAKAAKESTQELELDGEDETMSDDEIVL
ncbi:hypothetical protein F4803DRAFT_506088 [Xylaria telfairii]|nr:hypothetical protein F4803DRAFT_506088 [Xylaria telfairii]